MPSTGIRMKVAISEPHIAPEVLSSVSHAAAPVSRSAVSLSTCPSTVKIEPERKDVAAVRQPAIQRTRYHCTTDAEPVRNSKVAYDEAAATAAPKASAGR